MYIKNMVLKKSKGKKNNETSIDQKGEVVERKKLNTPQKKEKKGYVWMGDGKV